MVISKKGKKKGRRKGGRKGRGQAHKETVDIICPTYDNADQLLQFVSSALNSSAYQPLRIIIVNNGEIPLEDYLGGAIKKGNVLIVNPEKNLGWTGGVKEGLKYAKSKYIIFANDDIFIPRASYKWAREMVRIMETHLDVGAVGPTSNVVMGNQNIWNNLQYESFKTNFLIGFCVMVREEALDKIKGIDDAFNTGDDLDLSIRLSDAGYSLVVLNSVFVYHHGFQTGEKLYGKPDKPGGWNSQKMSDDTNKQLIQKHGFHRWWKMMSNSEKKDTNETYVVEDTEADIIKGLIPKGSKKIVELGCGKQKTVKGSIGVDIVPKGEKVPIINGGGISKADITCDVENEEIPIKKGTVDVIIARHLLEHIYDTLDVLKKWSSLLKKGGLLIIAVPDSRLNETISMNYEHLHAFTPKSLKSFGSAAGLKANKFIEKYNGVSFIIPFKKI